MKLVTVCILLFFLAGCGHCKTNRTRCDGSKIEICNSLKRWETIIDCNSIQGGEYVCVDPKNSEDVNADLFEDPSNPECLKLDGGESDE